MAVEFQTRTGKLGLNASVQVFHVAPVGEQREHRSAHGEVRIDQHMFKGCQICLTIARIGDIARNDYSHVRIEVVARVQVQR